MDARGKIFDQELGAGLNNGEEYSYDQIFKRYYKPLCFFAYKILLDDNKAEDIVQDNMIKLWERRTTFDSMEKIQAFLYVCVRNSCYDELEHQKVIFKHNDHINRSSEPTEETILESMMQAEVVRRVFSTVDTLPEQCRKVIKMTFEDGKSPKEISAELGITISTVSNQKMRGLILLKKRLSEQDVALAIVILLPGVNYF